MEQNGQVLRVVRDVPSAFAALVAEQIKATTGTLRLALSGGTTARACYEALAAIPGIEWSKVECYLGDERCVPPDDDDANQKMIRESLIDRVVPGSFFPMDCQDEQGYETLLEAAGPMDLVHLGLGPDGHTASLFPGSHGLTAPPGRLVVTNSDPSGHNPHERLSFTFEAIARARLAVFTVAGKEKREALARVLAGEDLPARRVRAGEVIFLADEEALGEAVR
jgi:6-phosphogluconolactonase